MIDEVAAFIEAWAPERRARVESLQSQIDGFPLSKDLQAYVIVPVAAGEEDKALETTFQQYVKQDMSASQWGLLFYVNAVGEEKSKQVSGTVDALYQLVANYPAVPMWVVGHTYANKQPIGQIRADAWDCALLDMHKKDAMAILGISNDADSVGASSDYIRAMVEAAERSPEKDMFNCQWTYGVVGNPESAINRILKYWEYTAKVQRTQLGRIGMADGNTAVRITSYVRSGGFSAQNEMGEMGELRQNIARQQYDLAADVKVAETQAYQDIIEFIPDIEMATDARRVYAALAQGYPPEFAWTHIPFGTDSDPTRTADTLELAETPLDIDTQNYILAEIDASHFKDIDPDVAHKIIMEERSKLHLPLVST